MAKDNGLLKTALIVGGVGAGAYFLFKKGGITDKIGSGIQSFTDSAGSVIQSITDGAGGAIQNITDGAGGAIQNITDGAGGAIQNITDGAGGAIQNITDGAGSIAQGITDFLTSDTLQDNLIYGQLGSKIVDAAKDSGITDAIGSGAQKAVEGLGALITGDKSYKWTGFKIPW